MIRRKYMRTRQLRPGMKMDQSVVDRLGRNLVNRGAVIDEYIIESLINLGVMNVYIQEGEVEEEEVVISKAAQSQIDKLYTEDRSKVSLSKSVRERISHGIQSIYSDTDEQNLASTTASITDDLMDAIDSNNAVAIDIGELKTSDE